MGRHDIENLLDRYLKGETSILENEQVESWLAENDNNKTEWNQLSQTGKEQWLTNIFGDIQQTISTNELKVVPISAKMQWWKSAAAVAAIFAISLTLFFTWPALQDRLNPVSLTALNVPQGQKRELTLPDGSKVWLNAGAELQYPQVFNGKTREVFLKGEAYFDIHHDNIKAFIVHTGKISTTVLGTAFNINAGINSSSVVVTVTRGKVSVANGSEVIGVITPNQQISYNIENNHHVQILVDAKQVIAWQEAEMQFDDVTFGKAAEILQQHFKVKISFTNELVKNCSFSGTALKGENLDQILKVICAFNKATYKYAIDGTIIIDGKGCN